MPLSVPRPDWKTEDVVMLEEQSRRFFDAEMVPHYEAWLDDGIVPRGAWERAGAQGLLCASMPEEYGGAGGSFAHEAVITEQLGLAGLDSFGIALHNAIVAPYILHYGSEDQKRRWLPKLASAELIGAIAMTEPGAGSDLQGADVGCKGRQRLPHQRRKTFITNGQHANLIIVAAKTDPAEGARGVSLFVVETDGTKGFRRGRNLRKLGLKAQDTSELFFDDMRVPADALLGTEEGRGFAQLMTELPQERLLVAVQAQAMIERALGETIAYVKDRKAFGKAVIEFQNTQFELAEMKTEATMSRVFVDHCIGRLIAGDLDTVTASMAKYRLSDLQCEIVDRCLQLFGGYGYMAEYPISRMYQDARVQRIYAGTNEIMKMLIARSL